jgi:hypothetical protein
MRAAERPGRTVGVDRLEPGDHAFLGYGDDRTRWDLLSRFTRQGLDRGEKVGLVMDGTYIPGWVAARVAGGPETAQRLVGAGQLVVSNRPRFARGGFDPGRLAEGVRLRAETAAAEGFTGLRCASEMSLALAPLDHLGQALEYERALHAAVFTGEANPAVTALCSWDERLFGATEAFAAVRSAHPVIVLPRPGTRHVTAAADGVRLSGDSDLASREAFAEALRTLDARPGDTLVLDLTDLSFFDAHSAGAVLRLAARLEPPRRLEVRCRAGQRRLLNLLGARAASRLSVVTNRL